MPAVAFLGLGTMGALMARNLLKAGHDVIGVDLNKQAMESFARDGGRVSTSAIEAVAQSSFVITMLPNDHALETIFLANGELLKSAKPDTLFIDCSTVSIGITQAMAKAVTSAGCHSLDAPVSGGPVGAREATLTFMIGGADEHLAQAHHLFEAMGKSIIRMGNHGAGQAAKQCNNMLAAIIMVGTAEAIALGVENGLDPASLCAVMKNSTGGSTILNRWNPWPQVVADAPSSREYEGGFQLNLMLKDLELAMSSARLSRSATPLGAVAQGIYLLCVKQNEEAGRKDFSYVQSMYSKYIKNSDYT